MLSKRLKKTFCFSLSFLRLISVCDFQCNDGTCQANSKRCDGVNDCSDGIDESNCGVCMRTEFRCLSTGACIDYLQRCDGTENCPDASDEQNCQESKCDKTEFICDDLNCVGFATRCDGRSDCPDGSDEAGCPGNYRPESLPHSQSAKCKNLSGLTAFVDKKQS